MPELESALAKLGRDLAWPETPALAPGVRRRLAEGRPRRFALPARRRLALAFALLAVAVGAVMAVPQTRAAILEFFGLRGVTIQRVEQLPEVAPQAPLVLGAEVGLERARELAGFELVLPEALGEPDAVYFLDEPPGGMVSFVYGDLEKPRGLFTQFSGRVGDVVLKKVAAGTLVDPVRVRGWPGYWLHGEPHAFAYVDANGTFREETVRLAGNVLLWERLALTLRLEADISRAEALEIARSVRP